MLIYDLPAEILSQIFESLPNNDLLALPPQLLTKGLPPSAAPARFHYLRHDITKASLLQLSRLSMHPHLSNIVKTLVLHTDHIQTLTTEDLHRAFWNTHLRVYGISRFMPACVTVADAHEAVGVKSWRECKACAGVSPIEQDNSLLRRFTRRPPEFESPGNKLSSMLVFALRLLPSTAHITLVKHTSDGSEVIYHTLPNQPFAVHPSPYSQKTHDAYWEYDEARDNEPTDYIVEKRIEPSRSLPTILIQSLKTVGLRPSGAMGSLWGPLPPELYHSIALAPPPGMQMGDKSPLESMKMMPAKEFGATVLRC